MKQLKAGLNRGLSSLWTFKDKPLKARRVAQTQQRLKRDVNHLKQLEVSQRRPPRRRLKGLCRVCVTAQITKHHLQHIELCQVR